MTKPLVLALSSVRGQSGKDTLIEQLVQRGHTVHRVAFADVLKEQCAQALASFYTDAETLLSFFHDSAYKDTQMGVLRISELTEGEYKHWLMYKAERDSENWLHAPRSPRWHLQKYGTEFSRVYKNDQDVWLKAGLEKIRQAPEGSLIVISDLRLRNEYCKLVAELSETHRVRPTLLHRMWFVPGVDDQPYHVSDVSLLGFFMNHVVLNHWGTPEAMADQLIEQGAFL